MRRIRLKMVWSVYRLAKEAGVSRSYIEVLEEGRASNIGLDTLTKILAALQVKRAILIYKGIEGQIFHFDFEIPFVVRKLHGQAIKD